MYVYNDYPRHPNKPRTSTVTEIPLHDSLNVQILSVQYGYRDSLGISTIYSTCTVTEAPLL